MLHHFGFSSAKKHMFSTPKTFSSCSEWFNSTPQFFMHAGVPPEHVALRSLKQLQSNSVMCTPAVVLDRKNMPVFKITTYWWIWMLVKITESTEDYWIFSACLPACLFLLQHQLYKFLGGWSSSITQRLWHLWPKQLPCITSYNNWSAIVVSLSGGD